MICIWSRSCHCHPIISCSSKIQNGLPFYCRLTQVVLEQRLLNGCSSSSSFGCSFSSDSILVFVAIRPCHSYRCLCCQSSHDDRSSASSHSRWHDNILSSQKCTALSAWSSTLTWASWSSVIVTVLHTAHRYFYIPGGQHLVIQCRGWIYTVNQKNGATLIMAITLSILGGFAKFFHGWKDQ